MASLLEPSTLQDFLKRLLAWYKKDGRHDMPWRKTKDPYAILVSEYMLQQTTVATVQPYYERFLRRFPTLVSLAKSDLNDVLALWSGLGYYARARNLWAAARGMQEKCRGKIPSDQTDLQKLPGIGPYTSGAITSLAFNKPAVVLDGNIIRVLMRLLAIEEDPRLKAVQVILRKLVFDMTGASQKKNKDARFLQGPRHVVLALMDLGATVCVPRQPLCPSCPVNTLCLARAYGKQNDIPAKGDEIERRHIRRLYAVLSHRGKWLVGQRPTEGLFGGLWEFVGCDVGAGIDPIQLLEEQGLQETGLRFRVKEAFPMFEHQLSHRIMMIRSYLCHVDSKNKSRLKAKGQAYKKFRWVSLKEIGRLGLSAITHRILTNLSPKNNEK